MDTNTVAATAALEALGFNVTEAALLCELTRGGPQTGYRLAHATSRSAANVYQALATLTQKGAVLVDDSDSKTYRAVPPAELLGPLRRKVEAQLAQGQAALEALHAPASDDRIYHLKTVAQVYEKARAIVDGARQMVLFDLFPAPFALLREPLSLAARRGLLVAGTVYADVGEVEFAALPSAGAAIADRWPGLQLTIVADAREHLLALLSRDGLEMRHGVWSDSTYLSCLEHSGLAAEIRLAARSPDEAAALGAISLLQANPDGLRRLIGPADAPAVAA